MGAGAGGWVCYDGAMADDRMTRVTLESGDVLLEGDDLTIEQIGQALEARFPDLEERERQTAQATVLYSDGVSMRPWRFGREEPRVVGSTGYF